MEKWDRKDRRQSVGLPPAAKAVNADDAQATDGQTNPSDEGIEVQQKPAAAAGDTEAAAFWPVFGGTAPGPSPDPSWTELKEAYPGHPALQTDTIYALPKRLVEAISGAIPKFFTDDEKRFERDLEQSAGAGFFLGKRIGFAPLRGARPTAGETLEQRKSDERQRNADASIREMMTEGMLESGASPESAAGYWKTARQMQDRLDERKWAYAGWLAIEPTFRQHVNAFRRKWGKRIRSLGGFPVFPMSFFGERPPSPPVADREFYDDYLMFYKAWSLHSLATWELPIPMRSEMEQPSFYDLAKVSEAGVIFFVPTYLLRDKDLKIRELTEHKLLYHARPHLDGWLNGKGGFGYERSPMMLKLYVYLELGLKERYKERTKGCLEKLDLALGRYLIEDSGTEATLPVADSVKKIRQAMSRKLKANDASS